MYARMGTGEPLPLPPLPDARAATLRVVTEPPGLPVTVDGMLAGASPVTVQVPAGLHRVEARHQDLGPQARDAHARCRPRAAGRAVLPRDPGGRGLAGGSERRRGRSGEGPPSLEGHAPPGQHELFVTAEAHAPSSARVSLLPGSTLKHEVRLELLPSRLRIASEPAGAELFVDGKRVGVTPWEGDVVTGPHSLKLQLAGHLPATRSLPADRPGQVSEHRFTLEPEPVELKLTSDPVGAEVWVDGRKVGITPYTGKVSPGPHRVELKRPGFDPVETVLQVAAGRALMETKTLVPQPVPAEITSTPEGASVRIDGREVGRTPWKGMVLPGPHALETVLEGHEPGRQAFVIAPAQPLFKAHHRLKAQPATLRVESEPAGADVLVDGKKVGVTPYRGPVAAGARKLEWRKAGYASQELAVQAAPGKELSEHRRLEPTPIPVSVASRPVGAELRIDGKALGKTPWKGTLAPGRHQLELSLEGHETTREDFTLVVGQQPLTLAPALKGRAVPFGVESEPRGAEVFVDGQRVGTTPFNGTLEPGAHQVVWKKHGHAQAEAKIVAVAGRPISERRTLTPLPVAVEVVSTPAGATVQLDGKPQGKTPWKGSVAPGAHELVVELAGHRSARQAFTLEPGQGTWKASPTLTREPVAARVESTPAGAEVRIDGRKVGTTPWSGEVPAEPFQLALLKDGHAPLELPVRPIAGRPVEEKHTLVPAPVVLRVKSEPAGAELRVDGKRVGTTPWEGPVAPGAHTLALALAHHAPAEAPVTVEVGRSAEQVLKLTPLPVFLSVQASPESAEIFVDGKRQGTSPVRVELVPGEHTIAVRAEAHSPRGETLTIAPGSAEVQRSYRLSPADVPLRVSASPEGAEVWLDGARVGNVPWEGKVSVGTHAVQVRAAGHAPAEVSVEAKPGEPLQQQLALEVLPVPVELRTKPEGAQVQIDGTPRGTTPVRVELMPGTHALELTARDHEAVKATRELKPGTGETWTFDLAQSPVEVALELRPATAQLTVGGQVQKAGAKVLSLLPGKHQLVATLDKHTTVERELVVTRAEGQKVSLLLVPALDGPLPPVAPTASGRFGHRPRGPAPDPRRSQGAAGEQVARAADAGAADRVPRAGAGAGAAQGGARTALPGLGCPLPPRLAAGGDRRRLRGSDDLAGERAWPGGGAGAAARPRPGLRGGGRHRNAQGRQRRRATGGAAGGQGDLGEAATAGASGAGHVLGLRRGRADAAGLRRRSAGLRRQRTALRVFRARLPLQPGPQGLRAGNEPPGPRGPALPAGGRDDWSGRRAGRRRDAAPRRARCGRVVAGRPHRAPQPGPELRRHAVPVGERPGARRPSGLAARLLARGALPRDRLRVLRLSQRGRGAGVGLPLSRRGRPAATGGRRRRCAALGAHGRTGWWVGSARPRGRRARRLGLGRAGVCAASRGLGRLRLHGRRSAVRAPTAGGRWDPRARRLAALR